MGAQQNGTPVEYREDETLVQVAARLSAEGRKISPVFTGRLVSVPANTKTKKEKLFTAAMIAMAVIAFGTEVAKTAYAAGLESAMRNCPTEQDGEKLLHSAQLIDQNITTCTYAATGTGVGRAKTYRVAQ